VAAYGMILRDSPYKGDATIEMAKRLVNQGLSFDPHGYRAELLKLMDKH
jgi:Ca-activated chloride channel family protein